MSTNDIVVSDMAESNFAIVQGDFVGAVSPVKSSRKKSDVKYLKQTLAMVIKQYGWCLLSQG